MSESKSDRASGGTLVLRDRRVAYASLGAQALLGRAGRDLLGRTLAELVAPEDRRRVLDRHERRLRGGPVPSEYELLLLLPDGTTRTAEARVSLEGQEVVLQLQDLTSLAGRRRRLELLAELGVAIQREWTEAAISQRVRLGLAAVDLSPVLMRPTGDGVELVWARFPAAFDAAVQAAAGRPLDGMVGRWTDQSRAVWSTGSAYSDDWITHGARFPGVVAADQLGAAAAALGLVRALAVRLDERRGSTGILVAIGDWIRHDDLPAFRLFGAQVATETLRTGLPTWTENTQLDPRSAMFGRTDVPALAMLAVPLAARASRRGVMLVAADAGHRFTAAERTLGSALGAELALALENAELYDQVLATNADLGREQEKNIRKSRLEALGELSAIIAHEVRNPLGVIFNSLGSLRRLVGPTGDARMLLDIVGEEADRLNRIVGDLLDFARHSPPVLVPDRLE